MNEQIQTNPFVPKDGQKYKIIQITDIALHTSTKRPTPSHGKKLEKSFSDMKPGRIYSPMEKDAVDSAGSLNLNILTFDEDFVRMVQEAEADGYKVVIGVPKTGIPVVLGSDTQEFIRSKNGKRVLRGLAKEKDRS